MFIFLYVYAIWFYNHKIEINYYYYCNHLVTKVDNYVCYTVRK